MPPAESDGSASWGDGSVLWEPTPRELGAPPLPVQEFSPAGDPLRRFLNPLYTLAHFWHSRHLISALTRRELAARYRGSFLGTLWSLLVPLLMLCVYTYVFSVVFKARWGTTTDSKGLVALTLLTGLVPYNLFAEVVATAPALVIGNTNYVKRVVFPLEILPLVRFLAALVPALISAGVLVLGLVLAGGLHTTLPLMLVAWLPLLLLSIAAAYFLAALGVFVRDTGQVVQVVLPIIFFLSPILYPPEAVPASLQSLARLNPIAHVVEDCRRTAVFGLAPNWHWLVANTLACGVVALGSFLFFIKGKRAFHDAL